VTQGTGVAPGQQFAGVVGVQGAEVRNSVQDRALAVRLEMATTNESTAAVVAREAADVEERLEVLDDRREELRESFSEGDISAGTYRAQLAELTAETNALERRADRLAATAATLPNATLDARGTSVADIESLRDRAADLTDEEAVEAAEEIAGEDVGEDLDEEDESDEEESDGDDGDGEDTDGGDTDGEDGDGDADEDGTDSADDTESDAEDDSTDSDGGDADDSTDSDGSGDESTDTGDDSEDSTDSSDGSDDSTTDSSDESDDSTDSGDESDEGGD
jgi:hypothetical protein